MAGNRGDGDTVSPGAWLGALARRPALAGPNGSRISLIIILAVGVAVTSVPVISKIFADLEILNTRLARLVLGVAVLWPEDWPDSAGWTYLIWR